MNHGTMWASCPTISLDKTKTVGGCKKTASKKSEIREERVSDDFLY